MDKFPEFFEAEKDLNELFTLGTLEEDVRNMRKRVYKQMTSSSFYPIEIQLGTCSRKCLKVIAEELVARNWKITTEHFPYHMGNPNIGNGKLIVNQQ